MNRNNLTGQGQERVNSPTRPKSNGSRSRYVRATDWDSKFNTYRSMRGIYDHNDPLFIAKAAFELAVGAPSAAVSDKLLLESIANAQVAKSQWTVQSRTNNIEATMFCANLPLLTAIHINGTHPSQKVIENARQEGVRALQESYPSRNLRNIDTLHYVGVAAELGALVLLQRFSLEQLGGRIWTPVPALLSQDRHSWVGNQLNPNWDLSIFTGDESQLCYKVQVKYGNENHVNSKTYQDDIAVVNTKYDLVLGNEREYGLGKLRSELYAAHATTPDRIAVSNLDARTDILMEIIDPPTEA